MSGFFADHYLTRTRVRDDAREISHRSGRNEQSGLATEHLRGALLQSIDRGVFDEDVVSDFRFGHRTPHFGGRPGYGVASEIDNSFGHSNSSVTPLARS